MGLIGEAARTPCAADGATACKWQNANPSLSLSRCPSSPRLELLILRDLVFLVGEITDQHQLEGLESGVGDAIRRGSAATLPTTFVRAVVPRAPPARSFPRHTHQGGWAPGGERREDPAVYHSATAAFAGRARHFQVHWERDSLRGRRMRACT